MRAEGATRVISNCVRMIALILAVAFVAFPSLAGQLTDTHVHADRAHQLNSQIDRLVTAIKDEYAAEVPHDRHVQLSKCRDTGRSPSHLSS